MSIDALVDRISGIREARLAHRDAFQARYESIRLLRALLKIARGEVSSTKVGEHLWVGDVEQEMTRYSRDLSSKIPSSDFSMTPPLGVDDLSVSTDLEIELRKIESELRSDEAGDSAPRWLEKKLHEIQCLEYLTMKQIFGREFEQLSSIHRIHVLLMWTTGNLSARDAADALRVEVNQMEELMKKELSYGLGDGRA